MHANPEPWVRLFWKTSDPLRFTRSSRGNRFDPLPSPWDTTNVLYAGSSIETALAEALLRWHGGVSPGAPITLSIRAHIRDRAVARFVSKRNLTLIDGTGLGRAPIDATIAAVLTRPEYADFNAGPTAVADDIFQCNASEYDETQRWAAWFRDASSFSRTGADPSWSSP